MEDEDGQILYIGKAKNLAKRVINYTSLNNLTRRLQRMVSLTKQMNFFVTNTEIEALLLECNLIKRHKPRFNIILRDEYNFTGSSGLVTNFEITANLVDENADATKDTVELKVSNATATDAGTFKFHVRSKR